MEVYKKKRAEAGAPPLALLLCSFAAGLGGAARTLSCSTLMKGAGQLAQQPQPCHQFTPVRVKQEHGHHWVDAELLKTFSPRSHAGALDKIPEGPWNPQPGDYAEARVFDTNGASQGTAVVRIVGNDPKGAAGQWLSVAVVAVSDDYLQWWLDAGPGYVNDRVFWMHLCSKPQSRCRARKDDPAFEFHVDELRTLALGDLTSGTPDFLKHGQAASDLRWESISSGSSREPDSSSSSPSAEEARGSKDRAVAKKKKKRKKKEKKGKPDRGPFAVGTNIQFGDRGDSDSCESDFRDAPTVQDRHLALLEYVLDRLVEGEIRQATDVAAQRIKALDVFLAKGQWFRAQHLELIPREGSSLVETDEAMLMVEKGGIPRERGTPKPRADPDWGDEEPPDPGPDPGGDEPDDQEEDRFGRGGKGEGRPRRRRSSLLGDTEDNFDWVGPEARRSWGHEGLLLHIQNLFRKGVKWRDVADRVSVQSRRRATQADPPRGTAPATSSRSPSPPSTRRAFLSRVPAGWSRPTSWLPISSFAVGGTGRFVCRPPRRYLKEDILEAVDFDYDGKEIHRITDINPELVIAAWPKEGEAAVCPATHFIEGDLLEAVLNPKRHWREAAEQPAVARKGAVHATDEAWAKVVETGFKRGMFTAVEDSVVPQDSPGHFVTNGAGAVKKLKDGREVQRFIANLIPVNEFLLDLPGEQHLLPYVAQMSLFCLEEDQLIMVDSEDLTSAFNFFTLPEGWSRYFSFSKKAILRNLVFKKASIPSALEINKVKPFPGSHGAMLYLDSFDEIRVVDGIQGGHLDGERGTLSFAPDKARKLVKASLALIAEGAWTERMLRRWVGLATFAAAFRRPLFSVLQEVFYLIEEAKHGPVASNKVVIDEIEPEPTCGRESEGGSSAQTPPPMGATVATVSRRPDPPPPSDAGDAECANCGQGWRKANGFMPYSCLARCGRSLCSMECVQNHRKRDATPAFAEIFAGPTARLTRAMAEAKVAVRMPYDRCGEGNEDFFTQEGKARLAAAKYFSTERGGHAQLRSGQWVRGPSQVRDQRNLLGLPWIKSDLNSRRRRTLASSARLSFFWESYLWELAAAKKLLADRRFYLTTFSMCCFGGDHERWRGLLHNSPKLHEHLNKPTCPGHRGLRNDEAWYSGPTLCFRCEEEVEYAWAFATAYSEALLAEMEDRFPMVPRRLEDSTLKWQLYAQVRGATVASYPFRQEDSITTLELTAAFCEIRRISRGPGGLLPRARLPGHLLCARQRPLQQQAWTLSGWNSADAPSRRFDQDQ
ncbi:unnamed protein product [Symbiodinium sp. CCMP2592]|nr:unnamed protein product [Symbiodinium sp. CCMP2592]